MKSALEQYFVEGQTKSASNAFLENAWDRKDVSRNHFQNFIKENLRLNTIKSSVAKTPMGKEDSEEAQKIISKYFA
jgi:uncharacterized protein with NRDE domain